ncbi:MAG: tetratricopeptide repeat protein [Acidobacteriota bacterium]
MNWLTLQNFFQLGFHAAALVFLYLGYRLLRQVVASGGEELPLKLKNVRFFMIMSLAFFVLGASLQLYEGWARRTDRSGARQLLLHLSPTRMPEDVPPAEVRLAGELLEFDNGRAAPEIHAATDMAINLERIRDVVVRLRAINRELQLDQAAALPDVGVGTDDLPGEWTLSDQSLREAGAAELDSTVARLNEALEESDGADSAAIRSSLGWVYYARGDFGAATAELERAASEAQDEEIRVRAYNNLGRVLLDRGDLEGSRAAFQNAGSGVAARGGLGQVAATEQALRVAN